MRSQRRFTRAMKTLGKVGEGPQFPHVLRVRMHMVGQIDVRTVDWKAVAAIANQFRWQFDSHRTHPKVRTEGPSTPYRTRRRETSLSVGLKHFVQTSI